MPVKAPPFVIEQPSDVCKVIALFALSLTPSMMSISPSLGQLGPSIQNAGLWAAIVSQCFNREQRIQAQTYHVPQIPPGI